MSGDLTAMDTLADCYAEMLAHDFAGIGDVMSADELLIEYGDHMSEKQRLALSAFIGFWDALTDLESETYQVNAILKVRMQGYKETPNH